MIKCENVTKKFDSFTALDNFSLEIEKGSAYGLIGANGAGKSTLLRILAGVYVQDSGRITVDGEPVYERVDTKKKIYYVSDETQQYHNMTLKEMKNFVKLFYDNFNEETFNRLVGVLNLPLNKKLAAFSKGMRRQAAVICAISAGTEYLLLDEVFDGLDPTMRLVVRKMLVDAMADTGLTVVMSSHNLGEIEGFCDRVGLLFNGSLVFNREIDTLKGSVHKVQAAFAREVTRDDFEDIEIMNIKKQGSVYNIIVKGDEAKIKQRAEELGAMLCDIVPLSLEEVFIYELEVLGYDFDGIDR